MHFVFLLARIYPFWAVPVIIVSLQLGVHFWRRRRGLQFPFWVISAVLLLALALWIYYRGDLNSDRWLKSLLPG